LGVDNTIESGTLYNLGSEQEQFKGKFRLNNEQRVLSEGTRTYSDSTYEGININSIIKFILNYLII
jgi:hypothetical protein